MEIKYECLPCLTRQLTRLAVKMTNHKKKQQDIIKHGLEVINNHYLTSSSSYVTGLIYDYVKKVTGINDPYYDEKHNFNRIAEHLIEELSIESIIKSSKSPIDTAIRLSIAGNIIDFSLGGDIDKRDVQKSIDLSLTTDIYGTTSEDFIHKVNNAQNILFIGDNSGEIVFDKQLIQLLPIHKITYVVKGGPIVNDATIDDAIAVGMDKLVNIIDSGAAIQGIELNSCSEQFIESFNNADMIIAKGQANYESLSELDNKNIFYLLRAKCPVIADDIGCKQGQFVLLNNLINNKK